MAAINTTNRGHGRSHNSTMMKRIVLCAVAFVALAIAVPVPAAGARNDDDASRPSAMASERALQSALESALSRPAPAQAPVEAVNALAFERDAAITAREREAFIAHLAKQPNGAGPLEQAIRSGKLMDEFDRLLQRYGYSPRNLGDVLGAYLVICWEIVSESDSNDEPAGQRAVRRQLAGPLAAVLAIARMSDAQKQGQAERTAYLTMVAASAYQELKRGGDSARLADLQRNVRASLLQSGIDLERLVLTEDGLVAR
jgi:hypothetical protein